MAKTLRLVRSNLNALVGIALVVALMATYLAKEPVSAHHEPANKFAAAGSFVRPVANDETIILSETMKVSTPFDLALSATVECSILTYLNTEGRGPNPPDEDGNPSTTPVTNTADTEGTVDLWIEIDGEPVPVSTADLDPNTEGSQTDTGDVTFCNRKYQRTVEDAENPLDGIDTERDFIRTRTANAFNWFALDIGSSYDKPDVPAGSGNNIVKIDLVARYTREGDQPCLETTIDPGQDECSDAYVGKRTLIAEPTNASVHEEVLPGPGAGN